MRTVQATLMTGGAEEKLDLIFDDIEVVALERYASDVEKLLHRSFLRSPDNFHLSFKFGDLQTTNPESSVTTGEFDEEQWSSFLHLFRPLAVNNDKDLYGFLRIRKLIERKATSNKRFCGYLNHLLEKFKNNQLPVQINFGIGGKTYDFDGVFELWLNAMEFHRDAEKRQIIDQMSKFVPVTGVRTIMANVALEKVRAMSELRRLIIGMLKPGGAEFPLSPR